MDIIQLVISVCHANAKHPKSRPTEAPQSHSYPTLLPPHREATQPPASVSASVQRAFRFAQNDKGKAGCQRPRSASVRRAFRFFAALACSPIPQALMGNARERKGAVILSGIRQPAASANLWQLG